MAGKKAGTMLKDPLLHDPRPAPSSRRVSSKKGKALCALGDHQAAAEESRPRKKAKLKAGRLLQEGEDSEEGRGHKEGEIRRRSPQSS